MPKHSTPKRKKAGRPEIEPKMKKVSMGVCGTPALIEAAKRAAFRRGESFSSYVNRAVQSQLLNEG